MNNDNSSNQISRQLLTQTIEKIDGAYAPATIRAYKVDFSDFIKFCDVIDRLALPAHPQTIVEFIIKLTNSGRSSASIRRAVAGIASIHKLNRYADPTKDPDVMLEMRRMHRKLGRAVKQAQGITSTILEKMVRATDSDIRGVRDRALLLVAYDTLCRRSEIISLRIEDVRTNNINGKEQTIINLRRSKTDQDGIGKWLHLSHKTQLALEEWLKVLKDKQGPLFRGVNRGQHITASLGSGQVNRIYKRIARSSQLEAEVVNKISGHSMRVGHAQDLVVAGTSLPIIMNMGRWSKIETVMHYVEHISYAL